MHIPTGKLNKGPSQRQHPIITKTRDSTLIKSISSGALVYIPMEEHALQIQWIADQSNENPRQQ